MPDLRKLSVCLTLLACLLAIPHAHAATVLALDLAALVKSSDHVALVHAQSKSSRYRERDQLIVTDVSLRVVSAWKGGSKAGDALIATHLGGSVGDLGLNVPGEAAFEIGKSSIVFLRKAARSHELHVVGMSQGVLPISGEGASARVLENGSGAELVVRGDDGKLVHAPAALTESKPLRDVIAEIARLCAQGHAR